MILFNAFRPVIDVNKQGDPNALHYFETIVSYEADFDILSFEDNGYVISRETQSGEKLIQKYSWDHELMWGTTLNSSNGWFNLFKFPYQNLSLLLNLYPQSQFQLPTSETQFLYANYTREGYVINNSNGKILQYFVTQYQYDLTHLNDGTPIYWKDDFTRDCIVLEDKILFLKYHSMELFERTNISLILTSVDFITGEPVNYPIYQNSIEGYFDTENLYFYRDGQIIKLGLPAYNPLLSVIDIEINPNTLEPSVNDIFQFDDSLVTYNILDQQNELLIYQDNTYNSIVYQNSSDVYRWTVNRGSELDPSIYYDSKDELIIHSSEIAGPDKDGILILDKRKERTDFYSFNSYNTTQKDRTLIDLFVDKNNTAGVVIYDIEKGIYDFQLLRSKSPDNNVFVNLLYLYPHEVLIATISVITIIFIGRVYRKRNSFETSRGEDLYPQPKKDNGN